MRYAKPEQQYVYRADVRSVVDGDTLDVVIDCGFRGTRTERLRLLDVNTPERKKPTRAAGDASYQYVLNWLSEGSRQTRGNDPADWPEFPFLIQTEKSDAFGRFLAIVWRADGACLNADLLRDGMAVPYED